MIESFDIPFTCQGCGQMLPQSFEEEDGLCYLCVPLTNEERLMIGDGEERG